MTRMRVLGVLAVLVVLGALSVGLAVRRARYTVTMRRLTDNVYLIVGSGLNVTVVITDAGIVLVDTMPSGWWGPAALARIRSVSDKPITTIINTNSHPGHSGNNRFFSTGSVEIVSHEDTKSRLAQLDHFKGANAKYLPQTTFRDKLSLVRGNERIDLYYFGAASTGGDAWVVFPARRLMHIGDIVKKNDVPEFERRLGGSGVAQPDTLAKGLAAIKDVDTIIVGHAYNDDPRPTMTWKELEDHQRQSAALLAVVRDAMKTGGSADEVAATVRSTETFKRFEAHRVNDAVHAIYQELSASRERATDFRGVGALPWPAILAGRHNADRCCALLTLAH